MVRSFFTCLVVLVFAGVSSGTDPDLTLLHAGVKEIGVPGLPGPLCVFGDKAFPVVVDVASNPVVAAARFGKGRVVVFGHEGFFGVDTLKLADTRPFVANTLRWAGQVEGDSTKLSVITRGFPAFAKGFDVAGIMVKENSAQDWLPHAKPGNVVVVSASAITEANQKALRDYVEAGGGMIVGLPGWGWLSLNSGKRLDVDLPLNRVIAAAGVTLADGTIVTGKTGRIAINRPSRFAHSLRSIEVVEMWLKDGQAPDAADGERVRAAVHRISGSVPEEFAAPTRERLAKAMSHAGDRVSVPTAKSPVTTKDPAGRILLGLTTQLAHEMPVEQVRAHPASAAFPGTVPAEAKRVTRSFKLDVAQRGYICDGVGVSAKADIWHSTGLYAAPGEVIRVTVPDSAVGLGLQVRIGSHSDTLWHLDKWQRAPEVCRLTPIVAKSTAVANAFGGLIYITIPVGRKLETLDVSITGAVEAARYVAGKTSKEEWKIARDFLAPWSEFESSKVVLTVPASAARKVEDPAELMAFWDSVLDNCADLTQVPRERGRAERLMHDVQISAGYMHSGYPIMCPLGEVSTGLDTTKIRRQGAWGYFHELGHNHQQRAWTFDGTTEVTCNLYSLYCYAQLCPKAPIHDAMTPEAIRRHAANYVKGGKQYTDWKKDPFTALIMYKQMEEAFGWDTYKKAILAYQKLPESQRPRTEAARRDEWLVQMSKASGKNLAPFFEAWSIPVSEAAKKNVANLAEWKFPDAAGR